MKTLLSLNTFLTPSCRFILIILIYVYYTHTRCPLFMYTLYLVFFSLQKSQYYYFHWLLDFSLTVIKYAYENKTIHFLSVFSHAEFIRYFNVVPLQLQETSIKIIHFWRHIDFFVFCRHSTFSTHKTLNTHMVINCTREGDDVYQYNPLVKLLNYICYLYSK